MAKADEATIKELKAMLESQLDIESRWYGLKHRVSETDLKDPIAVALGDSRSRLQTLIESFSN